ncbi:uncharacterized protein BXIN_1037 [Babesia sp. Xinjiang]|uniref:uncharacterized protein n=1 Tax=Babesia sp. Xinjiang TaxID=462227 RepID=UPI000A240E6C|nr:uncharacterized protein BXIN_1037 [Babesia sp. Xinjiang]ORM42009.1 hypothetical protein BXIN_1037 [Babesia sp. Xinjiang]
MGNSIGVDCSYSSKHLLDRLFVAILCVDNREAKEVDSLIAKCTFLTAYNTADFPATHRDHTLRLVTVATSDADTAVHMLSSYRKNIRNVILCGNSSVSLLSTLESLLPDAVISECDYDTCLHSVKPLLISSADSILEVIDQNGTVEPYNSLGSKGHLHAIIHSGASYRLYPPDSNEGRYIGHSVIGYSAVVSLFDLFVSRRGTDETDRADIRHIADLASRGSGVTCDMVVSDIYGVDTATLGLPGDLLASTFGKLQKRHECSLDNCEISTNPGKRISTNDWNQNDLISLNSKAMWKPASLFSSFSGALRFRKRSSSLHVNDFHDPSTLPNVSPHFVVITCLKAPRMEDVAHSLIKMVVINVTQNAALHAQLNGIDT